ncbi:tripartite tricarboxylate transporter TctB family protein [Roseicyclus sp.]|uniref:tripartite tricarboxylate transporter TctB family protein n=1 Tax=Roseicyclus sp. TaxID=1914329 RepID=UPI003F6A32CB
MNQPDGYKKDQSRSLADTAIGAGLIALGGLAALGAFAIAPDYDGSTTARIFPLMTAAAIAVMGALLLRARHVGQDLGEAGGGWAPWQMLAVTFGYLMLMTKVGYIVSTALAAPAALWVFGVRNPAGLVAAAILCPLTYHVVFFELLGTFPPYGVWIDPLLALGW